MERQNEPLAQQKPWEEMTEEERQVVRESWKHTLPEKFDVFCIGDMVLDESEGNLNIPGNLYVSDFLEVFDLFVGGSVIVDGIIDAVDITVQDGSCICSGDVIARDVSISNGNFISDGDIDVINFTIQNGDCIVQNSTLDSHFISVNGTLYCFDVKSHSKEIYANDYVCLCYENESK